jgi:hypothetical protein
MRLLRLPSTASRVYVCGPCTAKQSTLSIHLIHHRAKLLSDHLSYPSSPTSRDAYNRGCCSPCSRTRGALICAYIALHVVRRAKVLRPNYTFAMRPKRRLTKHSLLSVLSNVQTHPYSPVYEVQRLVLINTLDAEYSCYLLALSQLSSFSYPVRKQDISMSSFTNRLFCCLKMCPALPRRRLTCT